MTASQLIPITNIEANSQSTSPRSVRQHISSLQSPAAHSLEARLVWVRRFLPWVHTMTFIGFVLILVVPLFLNEITEKDTPLTHLTLMANYLIWGLWFPLVFISVIATGRSWCGLFCPMGAASEWGNKVGLRRAIPAWIQSPASPLISFVVITVLGQTLGVRDHPEAMAELFGGTMLLAILTGLIYGRRKRAWCRHLCPIGLLLGVFSRLGAIQFSPKIAKPGGDRFTEKTICPTMIDLPYKTESRHCIECMRCVYPGKRTGLFIHFRRPGREIESIHEHNPNLAEVMFLFLGGGLALGGFLWLTLPIYQELRQIIGTWFFEQNQFWIADPGPWWLMSHHPQRREVFNWLDFGMITGFMLACAIITTATLSLATAASSLIANKIAPSGKLRFRQRFTELGYLYAPVAMVSLVIGLATELFSPLLAWGVDAVTIANLKAVLLILSFLWSLHLGNRILRNQGLDSKRFIALTPAAAGALTLVLSWWPALFGV